MMDEFNWVVTAAKSWAARNNAVVTNLKKKPNGDWVVTGIVEIDDVLGSPPEPDPDPDPDLPFRYGIGT